jgi:hypothetical protein
MDRKTFYEIMRREPKSAIFRSILRNGMTVMIPWTDETFADLFIVADRVEEDRNTVTLSHGSEGWSVCLTRATT